MVVAALDIMLGGFDRMGEGDSKKMQKFVLYIRIQILTFATSLKNNYKLTLTFTKRFNKTTRHWAASTLSPAAKALERALVTTDRRPRRPAARTTEKFLQKEETAGFPTSSHQAAEGDTGASAGGGCGIGDRPPGGRAAGGGKGGGTRTRATRGG